MSLYQNLFLPLLTRMDSESAHERTAHLLERAQSSRAGQRMLDLVAGPVPARPVHAFGLTFPNPIGVAAGFDKNAAVAPGLARLGFGHIEVGTLTPRPQEGNPKPRVFRLLQDQALINRMGFPNCGVEAALPRLQAMSRESRPWILGVSLGKQKETPLDQAAGDYLEVMDAVYAHADYLAVNVSSPNTPDLRKLLLKEHLGALLRSLVVEGERLAAERQVARRPLLLKVSPDLSHEELDNVLQAALEERVDGLIATNTTLARERLKSPGAGETGGLSGLPLEARSNEMITYARKVAGDRLPIIGVGGVFTGDDVRRKLDAGACLVQVYTGLVYRGPGIAGEVMRSLAARG